MNSVIIADIRSLTDCCCQTRGGCLIWLIQFSLQTVWSVSGSSSECERLTELPLPAHSLTFPLIHSVRNWQPPSAKWTWSAFLFMYMLTCGHFISLLTILCANAQILDEENHFCLSVFPSLYSLLRPWGHFGKWLSTIGSLKITFWTNGSQMAYQWCRTQGNVKP